jgi:hypothetical protein
MNSIKIIITHSDENHSIDKCLKSVKEAGDSLILVDFVNSDKAREFCRLNEIKYLKNESSAINSVLTEHKDDKKDEFIFLIGSNEYISSNLRGNLMRLKDKLISDVYRFIVRKNYYGRWMKHSGLYPNWEARLFRQKKVAWTGNTIKLKPRFRTNAQYDTFIGEIFRIVYNSIYNHIEQVNKATETEAELLLVLGRKTSSLKIIFKPLSQFMKLFIIQMGFLDGFYGLANAVISAYSHFLTQVKLKYLRRLKEI